ncbi:hypothetical protein [Alienimonas chondri]|uniref:Uncharacterized protein n=1 Tax=Alienimonas chondri TaxID=2681879 RepID=A0ABX1VB99_9PLAN|nr:hypothetical protein [Alienimonas chondri]NNJ25215.1 hypothetical protein [Alienimonas chondri]
MTDDLLFWAIAVPLGIGAFFYLVSPALIRLATAQNAEAGPVAFDPDKTPPPQPVAEFWDDVEADLAPLGFARETHVAVHGLVPNVSILVAIFGNRTTDTAFLATFAYASGQGGGFTETQRAFELSNEYESSDSEDGVLEVGVVNSGDSATFPRDPTKCRKLLCEWIDDPATLVRIQKAIASEWGTGRLRPLPDPEDWEATARADMQREFADYHDGGHFERVKNGKRLMTWTGAYRATWKLLPPIKQIIKARRAARARNLLDTWGIEAP